MRRFETWVGDVLEGRLGGLLGARLQPVDIARRIGREMEDHRSFGAGREYVPNEYRVYLAPRTLAGFASFQRALEDELVSFARARAEERACDFVGRVRVSLLADETLSAERMRVEAVLVDPSGLVLGGGQATAAMPVVPSEQPRAAPLTLVLDRRRIALGAESAGDVRLGRALDNDVILDNGTVSRHHARLLVRGAHWMVEDLDSRHGTFVNERAVSASLLRPGDRLRFGALRADVQDGLADTGADDAPLDDGSGAPGEGAGPP